MEKKMVSEVLNEVVKDAMKTKLKIINAVINVLPEPLHKQVRDFEQCVLQTVHDVTGEYVNKKPSYKSEEGLKSIHID